MRCVSKMSAVQALSFRVWPDADLRAAKGCFRETDGAISFPSAPVYGASLHPCRAALRAGMISTYAGNLYPSAEFRTGGKIWNGYCFITTTHVHIGGDTAPGASSRICPRGPRCAYLAAPLRVGWKLVQAVRCSQAKSGVEVVLGTHPYKPDNIFA